MFFNKTKNCAKFLQRLTGPAAVMRTQSSKAGLITLVNIQLTVSIGEIGLRFSRKSNLWQANCFEGKAKGI